MLFRVENLGPLREAEVDLSKRLIVLTGPNNTGKTYLAWSVYGAHRALPKEKHTAEEGAVFDRWAREMLADPGYELDVREAFRRDSREALDVVIAHYTSQLHLCFGAERARFEQARIVLTEDASSLALDDYVFSSYGGDHQPPKLLAVVRNAANSSRFRLRFVEHDQHMLEINYEDRVKRLQGADSLAEAQSVMANASSANKAEIMENLGEFFYTLIRHDLFRLYRQSCVVFPAERIAVNIFARELALKRTEMVDEMVDAELDAEGSVPRRRAQSRTGLLRRTGRYAWPVRDSLTIANDLSALSKDVSRFADLAEDLERAVLGGNVGVSGYGEMTFAPVARPEHPLSVHLTASVVKSLASLVFYFRHMAQSGDFLIIDEPEMSLHPDSQRKVTQILAKAVRRGFKILMSTHSDYVVRELDHLIMLSALAPEDAAEIGYDLTWALDPKEVGVYLFDHERTRPVEVGETGFSVETIDAEIGRMQETSQNFYAKLSR